MSLLPRECFGESSKVLPIQAEAPKVHKGSAATHCTTSVWGASGDPEPEEDAERMPDGDR